MFRKLGERIWFPLLDADVGTPAGGATSDTGAVDTGAGGTDGGGGAPQGGSSATVDMGAGQSTSSTPDKVYTQAQVESMIKTRIAEAKESVQKQYGDHDKYKSLATRLAAMTGNTVDNIEAELEKLEAEAVSKQTGISPQVYQEIKAQQSQLTQLQKDNINFRLDAEEAKLMNNPAYKDGLNKEEIRNEVRDFAEKTGLSVEQAYWATQGVKGTQQMERDIEQRILASINNKTGKGGVISDSGGAPSDPNFGLTAEEVAFFTERGDDLEEMAILKGSNGIEAHRAYKKAKAKR